MYGGDTELLVLINSVSELYSSVSFSRGYSE